MGIRASQPLPRSSGTALTLGAGVACLVALMFLGSGRCSSLILGHHLRLAHLEIGASKVFYTSPRKTTFALADLQPVLPGHTLVVPRRQARRLSELSHDEVADLFSTVLTVQELVGAQNGATAFNLALKDGPAAGQPVPHLHVHVVPRKPGDLEENDAVYEMLDHWAPVPGGNHIHPYLDIPEEDARKPRTVAEMGAEAQRYIALAGGLPAALPSAAVKFGKFDLHPSQVFFASESGLSLAIVNLKPIVPGHVMVIPRRVVPRMRDLTEEELQDIWGAVRRVQALVQESHGVSCATLGVQDGEDAGQSVPHVHVHILPVGEGKSSL